jgi:beta-phosphoglucomutase-like phosphatase (HAD superfamily)
MTGYNRIRVWASLLTLISTAFAHPGTAQMRKSEILKQLSDNIEMVRTAATSNSRDDAAQKLAKLTRKIDPKTVDDKTIASMIDLLDMPDARYWVAVSLGNLGSRAKVAIPKLQTLLAEEDGRHVSKSAADGIRFALSRMGVTPPPPNYYDNGAERNQGQ